MYNKSLELDAVCAREFMGAWLPKQWGRIMPKLKRQHTFEELFEEQEPDIVPDESAPSRTRGINLNAPTVLVLNASYEPLHVCSIKRAITLLMSDIALRIEDKEDAFLHSPSTQIPVPSVIRLIKYVKRPPRFHIAFNRRNVFRRDNHACQFCGKGGSDLTLDHVIPRSRGGRNSWENIVTACRECNSKKRDRTPHEAKMKLIREPFAPKFVFSTAYGQAPKLDAAWEKYIGS